MNKEELKAFKDIQQEYLNEIRTREEIHTEEIKQQKIKYEKEILRYRRIFKTIVIIIVLIVIAWEIGYWMFGTENNTAYIRQNNGNIVQQQINNLKGE